MSDGDGEGRPAERATALTSLTVDEDTGRDTGGDTGDDTGEDGGGPGLPAPDLAALDRVVGGARVVGLGLTVAGSRELTTLAHRFLAHLVREHGVRRLALVAGESAAVLVDAHVRAGSRAPTGGGSIGDALRLLQPWSWATREIVAVVRWLAAHNAAAAPDDRVEIVGVDPQRPATAASALGRFLRVAAPDLLAQVRDPLADLVVTRDRPAVIDARDAVDRLVAGLDRDEAALVAATSPAEYAEARRHVHQLRRSAQLTAAPHAEADAVWARLMAEAVLGIGPGSVGAGSVGAGSVGAGSLVPTVLWGPAGHVLTPDDRPSVGARLRAEMGDGYRALLLTVGAGQVRALKRRRVLAPARRPSTVRLRPPGPQMLEARVERRTPRAHLLDLRDVDPDSGSGPGAPGAAAPDVPDAVATWVVSGCLRRAADDRGSFAAPGPSGAAATARVVPARELDAVAYVPRTRTVSDL